MATFPIVKGTRLRATKINSCGLPIAGAANYLVTDGFVTASIEPVMKDAEELEQTNAEGKVCVKDRTPPERKYYNANLELCNVNTGLITMFNGWEQVLDWDDVPVGFRDQAEVEGDYGVALEIWTGGKADDDCPTPTTDSIFSAASSGRKYGYLLLGGTEWTMGNIEIGAQVSTLTLTGISIAMPQWGRGPWNVAALDAAGTPGRLLQPTSAKEHITMFRTPVAPPEVTPGAQPCPLAIASLFTAPDFYFGGPANEPAADEAPEQAACAA
ncbi:major tail protein [Gordonia phage Evaa]|nr:major tail protein [Gordonia phage Evaa]